MNMQDKLKSFIANLVSNLTVDNAEGFPNYVKQAKREGIDVNEWIDKNLGWTSSLPILEELVFPCLQNNSNAIVCELGVGTGRQARYFVKENNITQLHLVDYSPWMVNFLKEYFHDNEKVYVHKSDGFSLPFQQNNWIDMIFSCGCFIEIKLSLFKMYAEEFFRVLKPGGYCIIDYIDIGTEAGWKFFETWSVPHASFTYQTANVVERVFNSAGLEIVNKVQIGKSTYIILKKPIDYQSKS